VLEDINVKELRCEECGSPNVVARIMGKYYCFKCGSKIVKEHLRKQISIMKEKGLIFDEYEANLENAESN